MGNFEKEYSDTLQKMRQLTKIYGICLSEILKGWKMEKSQNGSGLQYFEKNCRSKDFLLRKIQQSNWHQNTLKILFKLLGAAGVNDSELIVNYNGANTILFVGIN